MNIAAILKERAVKHPETAAIIDVKAGKDRVTSFAELEEASARGAALLLANGLSAGETALIFLPMSAELYIALVSLFRVGMTAMFLDPSAGREHIERCCSIHPPAALIASPKAHLLRLTSPALRRIRRSFSFSRFIPGAVPWSNARCLPPLSSIVPCVADTPALITFTSGSTSLPKGVVRSHGFLLKQHKVLEHVTGHNPGAVDLTTLPVFALANLASGVTSLLPDADLRRPGSIEPRPVLEQIRRFLPASVVASPAFLECLCDCCEATGTTVTGFRHVFTGGAPVFPDHLERFAAAFPGAEVVAVYGSTEAEPIAKVARNELSARDGAEMYAGGGVVAGFPVEGITVKVMENRWGTPLGTLDESDFVSVCVPPGKVGEIVVSGDHVLKGYLNGMGDEETKFRVGETVWHRTGDSGYFDAIGRLWLMGRASAVVNDRRGTLHPFAVECAVRQLPGIRRSALLGQNGQRILFVQPRPGRKIMESTVRDALAWAQLDEVREVREIPVDRRHNAKIDYNELSKML